MASVFRFTGLNGTVVDRADGAVVLVGWAGPRFPSMAALDDALQAGASEPNAGLVEFGIPSASHVWRGSVTALVGQNGPALLPTQALVGFYIRKTGLLVCRTWVPMITGAYLRECVRVADRAGDIDPTTLCTLRPSSGLPRSLENTVHGLEEWVLLCAVQHCEACKAAIRACVPETWLCERVYVVTASSDSHADGLRVISDPRGEVTRALDLTGAPLLIGGGGTKVKFVHIGFGTEVVAALKRRMGNQSAWAAWQALRRAHGQGAVPISPGGETRVWPETI